MFQAKDVDKIKTHFVFSSFFLEKRAVYEGMWKNVLQRSRPQMTIKYGACALHAGFLRLQNPNSEYVILFALLLKKIVARTRLNVTLYSAFGKSLCTWGNKIKQVQACIDARGHQFKQLL
jgi:hypothetical protein